MTSYRTENYGTLQANQISFQKPSTFPSLNCAENLPFSQRKNVEEDPIQEAFEMPKKFSKNLAMAHPPWFAKARFSPSKKCECLRELSAQLSGYGDFQIKYKKYAKNYFLSRWGIESGSSENCDNVMTTTPSASIKIS